MVTIEVKISDYQQPGSWETFLEVESAAEAASMLRYLKSQFQKEVVEGLVGRFERWDYRIAPQVCLSSGQE